MELRVVPVTDAPWDDVRTVFGTRGDPARCWCQYFKMDAATWNAQDVASFEGALCDQVDDARRSQGAGPGVLAYDGAEPVGWAAVEPRHGYQRIVNSRAVAGEDSLDVWEAQPGVSSAELFHGPLSVFEAAGFTTVERPSGRRAVVQLELASS